MSRGSPGGAPTDLALSASNTPLERPGCNPGAPAPLAPVPHRTLEDRIQAWVDEGRAIERTVEAVITSHRNEIRRLEERLAGVRETMDRMRESLREIAPGEPKLQ